MSTQSLDSDIYDYGFILNSTALHEAAISVLVTTIYGRWRTITGWGGDGGIDRSVKFDSISETGYRSP